MIQIFQYRSIGEKHNEEIQFFEFVVKSRFTEENNRSIHWCRFDGLKIIVETLEPARIDFVKLTLKNVIQTSNGHRWELA